MLEELVAALVSAEHPVIALVPEMDGVEGFGTTTLAEAACHRAEVRARFPEGIEWMTVGGYPPDLALEAQQRLLVLDDVPDEATRLLPRPTRKIPRRRLVVLDDVEPEAARQIARLNESDAVVLLTGRRAPAFGRVIRLGPLAAEAGDRSRGWPLLRALMRSLGAEPGELFDLTDPRARARAVHQVLECGLARKLTPAALERLLELGAFTGSRSIPLDLATRLWQETAGLPQAESERLLNELARLGLLARAPDRDVLLIPDVIRDHLREAMGPELAHRADRALARLFCSGSWLATRLTQAGAAAIVRDLARTSTREVEPLRRAVSQSLHLFGEPLYADLTALATLACRVHHLPEIARQLRDVLNGTGSPWLECLGTPPDRPHPALRRSWAAHEGEATSVAISPDGSWFATGGQDGVVRLWNRDGTLRVLLEGHAGEINRVAVAPDGTWLATGGTDSDVRLWTADGEPLLRLGGRVGAGRDVAISPDGTWLACLDLYGRVDAFTVHGRWLWSADTGSDEVVLSALTLAADGSWLAHALDDRIRVLNADGSTRTSFPYDGQVIALAPHPTIDALVTNDGRVSSLDGEVLYESAVDDMCGAGLAVAPDGTWLATGRDNEVLLIQLDRPEVERLAGHRGGVMDVAISPDGTWLASVSEDGAVGIWDRPLRASHEARAAVSEERLDQPWPVGDGSPRKAVAPDGTWSATGDGDGTIVLWSNDGGMLRRLHSESGPIHYLAISADSRILAAVAGTTVTRWTRQGRRVGHPERVNSSVHGLAISPDAFRTAVVLSSGEIRQWDEYGHRLTTLAGAANDVAALAYHPSGTLLAATYDSTVQAWDVTTSLPVTSIHLAAPLSRCAWSPDGARLHVAGDAGTYAFALHVPGARKVDA
ncbi:WD40 repeat domain-containing protein [Nonomuraea fuscirosea]|uniref:WD40 repeat domain-containing protein n=1 Tax=Nonomuraea fuscirosea TaxID=1291556 RepID=UPI003419D9E9